MNRPLFRARNLDPSKRIRLLVDQHDDNNNDLTNPPASNSNLLVSLTSTTTTTTTTSTTTTTTTTTSQQQQQQLSTVSSTTIPNTSHRCVPQMPFVSGMEREEEAEYHLQNALDAQQRLGSAKMRAVPIPDLYEDPNSQSIYPANVELPKQLIRLQPLQLESDEPEYDMDETDHVWFNKYARITCSNLTHLEYEIILDKLENASTRTLVSFDEARTLFSLNEIDFTHLQIVYEFWHKRRIAQGKRLKARLLTERDIKEEKGKHHPYVAFRRRIEKMTTRKNRKNDEQAYMSMLKLRSSFEAVVKLTNLIKIRETTKASLLECALAIFQARCESKPDDDTTASSFTLPTNHDRHHHHHHHRSNLKTSTLMNSSSSTSSHCSTTTQHQQLLSQIARLENHKKTYLSSASTLASLLQTPFQSQQQQTIRTLSNDTHDSSQPKAKRFKVSGCSSTSTNPSNMSSSSAKKFHRKHAHTDKLTQLLSSPTTPASPVVHNLALPSTSLPQSFLERLSPSSGVVFSSQQQQQAGRRRPKNVSASGIIKSGKNHRTHAQLSPADLFSLADSTPGGAILLKAQLFEAAKKLQQREELENNNSHRRVVLQDGSSVLSGTNENIYNRLDGNLAATIEQEEPVDPWQFRPKTGCRYLRPIDQDQQQRVTPQQRSTSSVFYHVVCSERGHLGKRRVRIGRGGRLLYDRHIEQENSDRTNESILPISTVKSHFTDKPVLWRLSSRPKLVDSHRLHSHLTVYDHTMSLAHHCQSTSTTNSIQLNDSFYSVNNLSSSTGGKCLPSSSIELDHPYSCSSRRVTQALRTLVGPQQPPPPPPPPPTPQPVVVPPPVSVPPPIPFISTPPTPPPSTTTNNNNNNETETSRPIYHRSSSSSFVLSPSTPFFSSHNQSYTIPSTPPPPSPSSVPVQPSSAPSKPTPPSCSLVQYVQLQRILTTNTHKFASSTPVTTLDS